MKKRVVSIIVLVCIIVGVLFGVSQYRYQQLSENGEAELLVETQKSSGERDEANWKMVRDDIKSNLEAMEQIKTTIIQPETYAEYSQKQEMEVSVTMEEGCSFDEELKKEIENYILATVDCNKVIINTDK